MITIKEVSHALAKQSYLIEYGDSVERDRVISLIDQLQRDAPELMKIHSNDQNKSIRVSGPDLLRNESQVNTADYSALIQSCKKE